MTAEPAIIVDNISKRYEDKLALENISFTVQPGELFGLIGSDGAGKSTLFRILTTLLLADKGTAKVTGFDTQKDYKKIRNSVGYMPGKFSLYQDLTVEENLNFFATLFGTTVQQNYEIIRDIYEMLAPFKDRKAGKLSGGMKQKLALCCALIHKPTVLFLDEPTTGVDPVSRKEFWEMLQRLKDKKITILVSTPYMDEASLCDGIALIQNGKILSINTPKGIEGNFNKKMLSIRSDSMYKLLNDLREYSLSYSVYAFGEKVHYTEKTTAINSVALFDYLQRKGHTSLEIEEIQAGIEDCFMDLMQ